MSIKSIIIFLFASISATANEEFILSPSIVSAYNSCFNLRINDAKEYLIEDKVAIKNNAFRYLIENYIDAISLLVEDDPVFYKIALSRRLKRLEALSECNQQSVFYYYVLSDVHLHWALVRLKFGDKIKAANELRLTAKYNKLNELKYPGFILNNKNNAVIQALASSIPPKFSWIGKQINIEGKIESALLKIDELFLFINLNKKYEFIYSELNLIKLFIEINLSGNLNEKINLQYYSKENKFNSNLIKYYLAINLLKQGESAKAKGLIDEIIIQKNGIEFNYLYYLIAEINCNTTLNDLGYFDLFLNKYKGESYIKSALRKKAWICLLNNNLEQYKYLMSRVLLEGTENTDEDKQALLDANNKLIPNKYLISARMYFDGGEYQKSLQQLSIINFTSLSIGEKSEFYYRRARCFQRKEMLAKAQIDFKNSISIAKLSNPYILAVSSFNLAQLYEKSNSDINAKYYYQIVLDSKQHPYKASLDAKSKAALQRLQKHY